MRAIFLAAAKEGNIFPFAYSERVDALKPLTSNSLRFTLTNFLKYIFEFMVGIYRIKTLKSSEKFIGI